MEINLSSSIIFFGRTCAIRVIWWHPQQTFFVGEMQRRVFALVARVGLYVAVKKQLHDVELAEPDLRHHG